LLEEGAVERRFATWVDRATKRLTTFGTEGLSLVRDRAKARITLAHPGRGYPSSLELVSLGPDLTKGYALCLCGRLRQAQRDLEHAKQRLEQLQQHTQAECSAIEPAQAVVVACAPSVHPWHEVGRAWRQRLAQVSRILQPWRLAVSIRQPAQEGEEQLHAEFAAITPWLAPNGLPRKQDTLAKVRKQLVSLAALVAWW
jgi:hypothetical protein